MHWFSTCGDGYTCTLGLKCHPSTIPCIFQERPYRYYVSPVESKNLERYSPSKQTIYSTLLASDGEKRMGFLRRRRDGFRAHTSSSESTFAARARTSRKRSETEKGSFTSSSSSMRMMANSHKLRRISACQADRQEHTAAVKAAAGGAVGTRCTRRDDWLRWPSAYCSQQYGKHMISNFAPDEATRGNNTYREWHSVATAMGVHC